MFPEKIVYPVFLPHAGCPFQCVYCNQHAVVSPRLNETDIHETVKSGLRAHSHHVLTSGRPGEVAFYGGTFTALGRTVIESVLSQAAVPVSRGIFTGIRFSTRPDCLDQEISGLLSKYPVRTIELGVQSLSDFVLLKSRRGYCARTAENCAKRVRRHGWKLGIQLMAGLPGDTQEVFLESIRKAIGIGPDFIRIYPTLVLDGTALAGSFKKGDYAPLSLDEAVSWLALAYDLTVNAGIPVIRMGLQPDAALERPGVILGGPYHPAFGCLVKSRWWRDRVDRHLAGLLKTLGGEIMLLVPPDHVGDAVGHRKSNLSHWMNRWGVRLKVAGDCALKGNEMVIID